MALLQSSQPFPLAVSGLGQALKQVLEQACESGTGRVLANPSPLIAADARMLAIRRLS